MQEDALTATSVPLVRVKAWAFFQLEHTDTPFTLAAVLPSINLFAIFQETT